MIKSSPVPPHELHAQSLIGEMTKSSLAVPATIPKSYRATAGFLKPCPPIGPAFRTSFEP
jgi:hypothetical protein